MQRNENTFTLVGLIGPVGVSPGAHKRGRVSSEGTKVYACT